MNKINEVMGLLNEQGYPTEIEKIDDNVIKSKYKDVTFFVSIYDNDSIQLFSFFNVDEGFSCDEINSINERLRFAKHYKLSNGSVCIEMDFLFDLENNGLFIRYLEIWKDICENISVSAKKD